MFNIYELLYIEAKIGCAYWLYYICIFLGPWPFLIVRTESDAEFMPSYKQSASNWVQIVLICQPVQIIATKTS